MRASTLAIVLLTAIAIGMACGGRQHVDKEREDKRALILLLWGEIRQFRHEAKMDLDPPPQVLNAVVGKTVPQIRRICPDGHKVPTSCNDICNIADDICDNADRICEIAKELGPDDSFANEKCGSAKASCSEAKQRCCKCSETGS